LFLESLLESCSLTNGVYIGSVLGNEGRLCSGGLDVVVHMIPRALLLDVHFGVVLVKACFVHVAFGLVE